MEQISKPEMEQAPSKQGTTPPSKGKSLQPWKAFLLLGLFLVLSFAAGYRYGRYAESISEKELLQGEGQKIAVHVKGAVARPGVYLFTAEQRVADAVESAQPLETADLNQLNLAAYLLDGSQVLVPEFKEAVSSLNINTATAEQLEILPGIGPGKAEEIIRFREENGYFSSVEELLQVSGISEKTLEGFRDLIDVE
ncbi:MAG: ComEA family DNA-binding protein [Bacillota bacterium]|nr:ComEA family DNA-binding protein [Bacillota bacterium]